MKAMVLAAGLGTRMRALYPDRPKPLIPLAGRTLIDHALDALARAGVAHVVVNLHWMGDQLHRHLAGRDRPAVIESWEDELLETGGGVAHALDHFEGEPFYVINSDAVWTDGATPALSRLAAAWRDDAMDALLLLQPRDRASGYEGPGDFVMADDGRLDRRPADGTAPWLFTGIQILHPRLFDDPPAGAWSLNRVYDRARLAGRLYGLGHDGGWYHVGTPEGLAVAEEALA